MLILSAKPKQERIVVDDRVEISVLKVVGNRVYLAIHGVEGSTIDRLSVAKNKRGYESPFEELFQRLKTSEQQPTSDEIAAAETVLREAEKRLQRVVKKEIRKIGKMVAQTPEERKTNGGKSAASTLREYKERRRLDVERELGEISEKLERVAAGVAFEPSDESTDASPPQDFHDFVD